MPRYSFYSQFFYTYGKHTIGYTRLLEARQAAFINRITMFHPNHQPPLSPCPFVDSLQFISDGNSSKLNQSTSHSPTSLFDLEGAPQRNPLDSMR
jgi:hypothetical protein